MVCEWCDGLGFALAERDDGIDSPERCDACDVIADDAEASRIVRALLDALAQVKLGHVEMLNVPGIGDVTIRRVT